MSKVALPLERFAVLDLTTARAGPTAVRQLADWGARVVRIERPGAVEPDATGSRRDGFDFQNLHRNKRSISLDLKKEEGQAIFMKMAERADVIIENFRSDVKHRLGIDYYAVRSVNPRIVYGSISGFGQDGPYASRSGVDQIAQGMSGLMSVTGEPGRGPMRVGIAISDMAAGLLLAQAILVALLERQTSGEGQWVHTSLIEAQIYMLDFQAARWLIKGEVAGQEGNNHPTATPTGVYPTQDGHINIAASGENLWRRFCEAINSTDLLNNPLYATTALRTANRDALNERLLKITPTKTSAEWLALLGAAGVPCGPINRIDETFADPQVRHLGITWPIEHPRLGYIEVVGQPIHFSRFPRPEKARPTPELGQHTHEVLAELGVDAQAIAQLQAQGVI